MVYAETISSCSVAIYDIAIYVKPLSTATASLDSRPLKTRPDAHCLRMRQSP